MIFEHCIHEYSRKIPTILIALRGDQGLYRDAIRLYHAINFHIFLPNDLAAYDIFSQGLAAKIQKLHFPNVPWLGYGYVR
jgi:hypothetical protein